MAGVVVTVGLGILATALVAARFQWVEEQIFEILGRWSLELPEPEAKLLVARHAAHHGWHAQLWSERVPNLREGSVRAPDPSGWANLLEAVQESSSRHATALRLAGMYRVVLPRLIGQYRQVASRTSEAADRPVMRTIRLVTNDEHQDAQEGEILLQSLLREADAVSDAQHRVIHLEAIAAGSFAAGDFGQF